MLSADDLEKALEIVQVLPEILYVAAPPLRVPVTAVIAGVDRAPPRCEPGSEALIATAVLGVAVNHDEGAPRYRRQPCPAEQPQPVESPEVGLGATHRFLDHSA